MGCNLCAAPDLRELGYLGPAPVSVTSEPKLCPLHAKIYCCSECNHLQKVHTLEEKKLIDLMYDNYDVHNLSRGNEQLVFPENLPPRPRTYHALEQCLPFLPTEGRLLDIGTGNGAVLKSASKLLSKWNLYAFDISDTYRETILEIPNVVAFSSGSLQALPHRNFNLIVLWHALEHVPDPVSLLAALRELLADDGFLLIQVPDVERTPFDLAVIDHCSHFTNSHLLRLCRSVGLELAIDGHDWSYNCISFLLKRSQPHSYTSHAFEPLRTERYFHWLNDTVEHFEQAVNKDAYAIFGTGMASIWISGELSIEPRFFIDEDRAKAGNHINGIPIIMPEEVPADMKIIMAFTNDAGRNIGLKIQKLYSACAGCNFILSPTDPLKMVTHQPVYS